MDFWSWFNGMVHIEITSADPLSSLQRIQNNNISTHHVQMIDILTIQFIIRRQDLITVKKITTQKGESLKILENIGIFWHIKSGLKRPILMLGILFLFFLTMFIPTRILFFQVEGNEIVPTKKVLDVASQYGIHFGAIRSTIRSEQIKNALLQACPELEWAGINTAGCVATISVRERRTSNSVVNEKGVSSIIATRDGVIQEMTVINGNPVCKVGQGVKKGQVLISGYTDCGLTIQAGRANGEIYAITNREMVVKIPAFAQVRNDSKREIKNFSIIFGKKRINLYQDSGILHIGCVKIYEEKYVTLPGGFQLPCKWVIETCTDYNVQKTNVADSTSSQLHLLAQRYLHNQMVAGKILSVNEQLSNHDDVCTLTGKYECIEMIGKELREEIITP